MTSQQKQEWTRNLEAMQKTAERNWIEGKKEDKKLAQRIRLAQSKLGM